MSRLNYVSNAIFYCFYRHPHHSPKSNSSDPRENFENFHDRDLCGFPTLSRVCVSCAFTDANEGSDAKAARCLKLWAKLISCCWAAQLSARVDEDKRKIYYFSSQKSDERVFTQKNMSCVSQSRSLKWKIDFSLPLVVAPDTVNEFAKTCRQAWSVEIARERRASKCLSETWATRTLKTQADKHFHFHLLISQAQQQQQQLRSEKNESLTQCQWHCSTSTCLDRAHVTCSRSESDFKDVRVSSYQCDLHFVSSTTVELMFQSRWKHPHYTQHFVSNESFMTNFYCAYTTHTWSSCFYKYHYNISSKQREFRGQTENPTLTLLRQPTDEPSWDLVGRAAAEHRWWWRWSLVELVKVKREQDKLRERETYF